MQSYSGYISDLSGWFLKEVDKEWDDVRMEAMRILQTEDDLKNIVKLVGPEALPDKQRLVLETARLIREAFLQQNALDPVDTYCTPAKQFKMLKLILDFNVLANRIVSRGAPLFKVTQSPILTEIIRIKTNIPNDKINLIDELDNRMRQNFEQLEASLR